MWGNASFLQQGLSLRLLQWRARPCMHIIETPRSASCLVNCNDRAPSTMIIRWRGGGFSFHLLGKKKIPMLKPKQVCTNAGDQAVSKHDPECYGGVLKSAMMNSRRTKCRESTFLNFVIQWSPSSTLPSVLCRPSFVLRQLRFLLWSWWLSAGLKWSRAGGTYASWWGVCIQSKKEGIVRNEWVRGTGGRSHWFKFTFTCRADKTTRDLVMRSHSFPTHLRADRNEETTAEFSKTQVCSKEYRCMSLCTFTQKIH